jgi:hypothetical protein
VTLLSRVRTALRETRSLENPSYPLTSSALIDLFAAPNTHSGVRIDEKFGAAGRRGLPGVVADCLHDRQPADT